MTTNGSLAGGLANYQMFIGGKWVDASSGETFESVYPYTGAAWARVPGRRKPTWTPPSGPPGRRSTRGRGEG